jgi:uncharacterized membrane protein YwaF
MYVIVAGSAALALWIFARFSRFGPQTLLWAGVHVVIACVVLRLLPFALDAIRASRMPAAPYIAVLGVTLPLFVYAFLTGSWVGRAALGLLRR